jgi:NAD(P)-dependent dehydrogenase (short-subunit alcohol dehydrogenase family)
MLVSASSAVAVVLGAGGGIGGALVRRIRADASFERVIGLGRTSRPAFNLTDEDTIEAAANFASAEGELDLIIDATGFLHDQHQAPEKSWKAINAAAMSRAFALNAIGPALIMKHWLPLLPRRKRAVFATLSARVGSIGDNRLGGWYSYRASKAALNQLVHTAAIELARTHPQAICVALHPGTVDTQLSAPFAKQDLDVQSPDQAAARLIDAMARLTPGDSGGFFDYRGEAVPWRSPSTRELAWSRCKRTERSPHEGASSRSR